MKRYRVNYDLRKYVRQVLVLSRAKWRMVKDKDGQLWCITNLSSNHFHDLVLRARCEKVTEETGILHVTFKESCNTTFTNCLMRQRGVSHYCVIDDTDGTKFRKHCMN